MGGLKQAWERPEYVFASCAALFVGFFLCLRGEDSGAVLLGALPITGAMAKCFYTEYALAVRNQYRSAQVLNVLRYNHAKQVVTGSNLFAATLANQILRSRGYCVATLLEVNREQETRQNTGTVGTYADMAVVLRAEGQVNSYLAGDLEVQLQSRSIDVSRRPVVIPINCLELKFDESSPYGVSLRLMDCNGIIASSALEVRNGVRRFSQTDQYGIPIPDGRGNRLIFTKCSRLSLLRIDEDYDCRADLTHLDDSSDTGRILVGQPSD